MRRSILLPIPESLNSLGDDSPGDRAIERMYWKKIQDDYRKAEKTQECEYYVDWLKPRIAEQFDPKNDRNSDNRLSDNAAPCNDAMIEL